MGHSAKRIGPNQGIGLGVSESSSFQSAAASFFASLYGFAPIEASSGKVVRHRLNLELATWRLEQCAVYDLPDSDAPRSSHAAIRPSNAPVIEIEPLPSSRSVRRSPRHPKQ